MVKPSFHRIEWVALANIVIAIRIGHRVKFSPNIRQRASTRNYWKILYSIISDRQHFVSAIWCLIFMVRADEDAIEMAPAWAVALQCAAVVAIIWFESIELKNANANFNGAAQSAVMNATPTNGSARANKRTSSQVVLSPNFELLMVKQ